MSFVALFKSKQTYFQRHFSGQNILQMGLQNFCKGKIVLFGAFLKKARAK